MLESVVIRNGVGEFRPRGRRSLVEAVDLVSRAIAECREHGVTHLLVDVRGLEDVPVPTLIDRFLAAEDWAQEAQRKVVVGMVAPQEIIHPRKFGVKVAAHFGMLCEIFTSDDDALDWLRDNGAHSGGDGD